MREGEQHQIEFSGDPAPMYIEAAREKYKAGTQPIRAVPDSKNYEIFDHGEWKDLARWAEDRDRDEHAQSENTDEEGSRTAWRNIHNK